MPEIVLIIYLILFNSTMQLELLLSHYRDEETGTERVNNFSKVTQLVGEVSGKLAPKSGAYLLRMLNHTSSQKDTNQSYNEATFLTCWQKLRKVILLGRNKNQG